MQATVHRFDEETGAGSVLLDDGRELPFTGEVFGASALRHVRNGQRVSVELDAAGAALSRLWIVGIGEDERIA
jgi:cold shock CspA family protein